MTDAYPLAWPDGWPRTRVADRKHGYKQFQRPCGSWTFPAARDALIAEIWMHGPARVVLSSNFQPGPRGPLAGKRRPDDEAIAIYFDRAGGRDYAMACDRYHDAEGNMRSLTLALEAMRQLDRHGGGVMLERAFQGFLALSPPKKAHEILGVTANANAPQVREAWRKAIAITHPDQGGSQAAAAELNAARDQMLRGLSGG